MDKQSATALLKKAVGDEEIEFRPGQWEAIDALCNQKKKLLVVERTGWGKSSVYFISTSILREQGAGPTIIVSPLLALMRNQIEMADRLDIQAATINSTNADEWADVKERILNNQIDALLISPERLANDEFVETVLLPVAERIGLLVVDEAHCVSDWGHDFRPDYRRLTNILNRMPPNMPILGTTATANNRVIQDVREQLGDIGVQRGTLVRESLYLQTIRLRSQTERLAWLAQYIPNLPGTGIVYCLTKRDATRVAEWLSSNGVNARAYFSDVTDDRFEDSNSYRLHLEDLLLGNEIKVLVATTALGMGYDKPDLGFVIHYQAPGSIVGYYQQIGRAGRGIDKAYCILLSGSEDQNINEFFRESAFPEESQVNEILEALENADGMKVSELEQQLNMRRGHLDKVLKLLSVENPAPVIKQGAHWHRTPVKFQMDHEKIDFLTRQREMEWQEVQSYIAANTCLMAFLQGALDDPQSQACGRCAVCVGRAVVPTDIDRQKAIHAAQFLRQSDIPFKPKIQVANGSFPTYEWRGNFPVSLRASEGRILSRWGDAGWGGFVKDDKYSGHFRDELVTAVAEMIRERWQPSPAPEWITCVPSLRHPALVPDFANRLAQNLGLPFLEAVRKIHDNDPQKSQHNRYHQCNNLDGAFQVDDVRQSPVFLVDDIIDSGWTVTVIAALLRQAGSGEVYPLALATTTPGN